MKTSGKQTVIKGTDCVPTKAFINFRYLAAAQIITLDLVTTINHSLIIQSILGLIFLR